MSNTSTFALGLGSGLALWHFSKPAPAQTANAPAEILTAPGPRSCFVRVTATGFIVDGASVDFAEAVRRCRAIGHATITVEKDAPASSYAALLAALEGARVPMVRNSSGQSEHDTKTAFTLITYPQERSAGSTTRHFRAEKPITWSDARDRLAAAGHLDLALAGRTHQPGGWMLSIASRDFRAHRAEPLPKPRNAHVSSMFTLVVHPDGFGGTKRMRWFRANPPTTWQDARHRLAKAGILDKRSIAPGDAGYWKLVTDARVYKAESAEPLPGETKPRGADAAKRFSIAGRTISRDGDPILHLERVDLGDARYAISPHHADLLAQRIVRLLNEHGAR
jgi:hypothetical protein